MALDKGKIEAELIALGFSTKKSKYIAEMLYNKDLTEDVKPKKVKVKDITEVQKEDIENDI